MATIFDINNDDDEADKINMDELYETKHEQNLQQLAIYQKLLSRVHARIKVVSRQRNNEQCCWYVVPEVILGVPLYNNASCIAFMLDKLQENGFVVRYTHPNLLFISWKHWVPSYVRTEIKKKTGKHIDGYGNIINNEDSNNVDNNTNNNTNNNHVFNNNNKNVDYSSNPNDFILKGNDSKLINTVTKKEYKSTNVYKPLGNLIYNNDVLNSLTKR